MNSKYDNEWSDDLHDNEYPAEDDWDDDEDSYTVPCPQCEKLIYEDVECCPACGEYITHSNNVWNGRPSWWIILALLGILAVTVALGIGI